MPIPTEQDQDILENTRAKESSSNGKEPAEMAPPEIEVDWNSTEIINEEQFEARRAYDLCSYVGYRMDNQYSRRLPSIVPEIVREVKAQIVDRCLAKCDFIYDSYDYQLRYLVYRTLPAEASMKDAEIIAWNLYDTYIQRNLRVNQEDLDRFRSEGFDETKGQIFLDNKKPSELVWKMLESYEITDNDGFKVKKYIENTPWGNQYKPIDKYSHVQIDITYYVNTLVRKLKLKKRNRSEQTENIDKPLTAIYSFLKETGKSYTYNQVAAAVGLDYKLASKCLRDLCNARELGVVMITKRKGKSKKEHVKLYAYRPELKNVKKYGCTEDRLHAIEKVIVSILRQAPSGLSYRKLRTAVAEYMGTLKRAYFDTALDSLINLGTVSKTLGPRNSNIHTLSQKGHT